MAANDLLVLNAKITETKKQRAPDLKEGDFFELYVAEQVLKDFEPSDDEIETGLVGGTGDGGLDGLYFLVNRQFVMDDTEIESESVSRVDLVLIQATSATSFNENRVDKLLLLTDDLLDLSRGEHELKGTYNPVVLAAVTRFKEKYKGFFHVQHDMYISYHYVCKGDTKVINAALNKRKQRVLEKANELFPTAHCSFAFVGAEELIQLIARIPQKAYPLALAEAPISPKEQEAFICLVPLQDYYRFISDENGELRHRIFDSNVRDWQGNNKVNEEIKKSLEDENAKEDFWWLNNGVTILASKVSSHGGQILRIENPQIVNGLQTSRYIYHYMHSKANANEWRKVLIRIIAGDATESQDKIIKATNSQTNVPEYSLHATEKIHRDIEVILRNHGLFYDRRKNFYKNQGKPISKIVEPLYLAQTIISIVLQQPDNARARPSTVVKNEYEKIYKDSYPLQLYATSSLLMKKVDAFLVGSNVDRRDRINLRWYVVMHYSCQITGHRQPDVSVLSKLSVPYDSDLLHQCFEFVKHQYVDLGATDQVAKGTALVGRVKGHLL